MSEAESVISVLLKVSEDESTWPQLAEESKSLLTRIEPSFFLHGAVTIGTPASFIAQLGLDPQFVANYSTKLVQDSVVARKQYQRVIGEHTRVLTYDMLTECTDGYARLLRLFSDMFTPPEKLWAVALQLIGQYNLEPFKVMTIWVSILLDYPNSFDAFAKWVAQSEWRHHPDWTAIVKLVGQFNDLSPLLATLILNGAVDFGRIYAFIKPSERALVQHEQKWKSSGVVVEKNALMMAMPLVDDDDEEEDEVAGLAGADFDDGDGDDGAMEIDGEENGKDYDGNDKEDKSATSEDDSARMEKSLLLVGDILTALAAGVVAMEPTLATSQLYKKVEKLVLSVVYSRPLVFTTCEKVGRGLSHYLAAKLPQLGRDGVLNYLVPHAIYEPLWGELSSLADEEYFRRYMLPSLDLHPSEQPLLWSMPATQRYAIYTEFHSRVATQNLVVKTRFSQAEKDTKDVLKRLTRQDAESLIVPQLMEIFARCPWPSLNVFVNQVENYNIGQLVARSSKSQIAPLAMDMLPLILMQQFTADGRVTKQQDGLFDQKWFRLLAQFAGDVAVAYETFDFVSLIKLMLQQFAERDFSQLVVIEQLLRKLSGIPAQTNLSSPQIVALSMAEPVRSMVCAAISEQHDPQRSRLLKGIEEAGISTELLLALGFAYNNTAGSDAKVVASQLDQITNVALLYLSLLPAPLDSNTLKDAGVPKGFIDANELAKPRQGSGFAFSDLQLYDLVMEQDLYNRLSELGEAKDIERASLSHRLRVKSVTQHLVSSAAAIKSEDNSNAEEAVPALGDLVERLLLSPSDAIYTSRYLQIVAPSVILDIFKRGVLLMLLRRNTPFETESLVTFIKDVLASLYISGKPDSFGVRFGAEFTRKIHESLTAVVLEAAYPDADYTPLSNTFSLLQRALPVFPLYKDHGTAISSRVRLLTTKMRGDLETAVKSLSPQLSKRAQAWQDSSAAVADEVTVKQLMEENERLTNRLIVSVKLASAPKALEPEAAGELKRNRSSPWQRSRKGRSR